MNLTLENIAEIGLGASTHGRSVIGQGSMSVRIINIKDVRDGYLDFSGVDTVSAEDEQKISRYLLKKGDIVLTLRGSVFRAALVDDLSDKTIISSNLAYLRLKPNAPISPLALCGWLNTSRGKMQAELLMHGSGVLSISTKDLRNMPVYVPDRPTQDKLERLITVGTEYKRLSEQVLKKRELILEAAIAGCFSLKFKYKED